MTTEKDIFRALFPGLEIREIREIGVGWNSAIRILDGSYVVKIPRTAFAGAVIEKEIEITDSVRGIIDVEVPRYIAAFREDRLIAAAYPIIQGNMLTSREMSGELGPVNPILDLDLEHRERLASQLSEILNALHGTSGTTLDTLKKKLAPFEKETWEQKFSRQAVKWRKAAETHFSGSELDRSLYLLDSSLGCLAERKAPMRFIHGDFGGWNILFDRDKGEISGILDWGDSCFGDPAFDFAELLYDFGRELTNMILSKYKFKDDSTLLERALCYLRLEGFRDLQYGDATGSEDYIRTGKENIRWAINGI